MLFENALQPFFHLRSIEPIGITGILLSSKSHNWITKNRQDGIELATVLNTSYKRAVTRVEINDLHFRKVTITFT